MINSIAIREQIIENNDKAHFTNNQVRTKSSTNPYRGWLDYNENEGTFILTKPGVYRINYNANVTLNETGQAILALSVNEKILDSSITENTIIEPGLYTSVSSTVLVKVAPYDFLPVSLQNVSEKSITIKDASITIDKVA